METGPLDDALKFLLLLGYCDKNTFFFWGGGVFIAFLFVVGNLFCSRMGTISFWLW